ncbi:MAG: HAD-IIB family hydrolase [Spirochaetota bacterium]|jgi:mannosyl-3-phosphoglycerate phosphatase
MDVFPVVFSDIDGTILDYTTYSYTLSLPAIQKLVGRSIPLILVSSKTYAEMLKLNKKLSLTYPFIFENGAGIANPDGSYTIHGKSAMQLALYKPVIEQVCGNIQWADKLSLQELSAYTGLSTKEVKDMMTRMASVLCIAPGPLDIEKINKKLAQYGIAITTGGRFITVIDSTVSKGNAVQIIQTMYREKHATIYSYAIGDGINDTDMFTAVDEAYFVGRKDLWKTIKKLCPTIHKTKKTGPAGFNEVVDRIVKNYSLI